MGFKIVITDWIYLNFIGEFLIIKKIEYELSFCALLIKFALSTRICQFTLKALKIAFEVLDHNLDFFPC